MRACAREAVEARPSARAGARRTAIGLSGQMHGLVLTSADGRGAPASALLWADSRATGALAAYRRLESSRAGPAGQPAGPRDDRAAAHVGGRARTGDVPGRALGAGAQGLAAGPPHRRDPRRAQRRIRPACSTTCRATAGTSTWSARSAWTPACWRPCCPRLARPAGHLTAAAAAAAGAARGHPGRGRGRRHGSGRPRQRHRPGRRPADRRHRRAGPPAAGRTGQPGGRRVNLYRSATPDGWYQMGATLSAGLSLQLGARSHERQLGGAVRQRGPPRPTARPDLRPAPVGGTDTVSAIRRCAAPGPRCRWPMTGRRCCGARSREPRSRSATRSTPCLARTGCRRLARIAGAAAAGCSGGTLAAGWRQLLADVLGLPLYAVDVPAGVRPGRAPCWAPTPRAC